MGQGRKKKDAMRAKYPTRRCVEGHCSHPLYKNGFIICPIFCKNIRENKTPSHCRYYIHN